MPIWLMVLSLSGYSLAQLMGGGVTGGGTMNEGQSGESSLKAIPGAGIFRANCVSCHPNGKNVVTPGLPLKGSSTLADFGTFLNFIRHPKMPDGSTGSMRAFSKSKISDGQASRLYQFITSTEASGMRRGYGMRPGMMGGLYEPDHP
jgi:mono/diheme cytochrome c family protein